MSKQISAYFQSVTRIFSGCTAVLILAALSVPARADVAPTLVWDFTGTCTDCGGTAHASLELFEAGGRFDYNFHYTSNWIYYDITNPAYVDFIEPIYNWPNFSISTTDHLGILMYGTIYTTHAPGAPTDDYTGFLFFASYGADYTLLDNKAGTWSTGPSTEGFPIPDDVGVNALWLQAPEIDAATSMESLGLLTGCLLLLRRRRA